MENEQQLFSYFFFITTSTVVVNDPAFRRKTLLTPARPPLGVTESATDGVVFTTVTTSARKYGSYEPPDPGCVCAARGRRCRMCLCGCRRKARRMQDVRYIACCISVTILYCKRQIGIRNVPIHIHCNSAAIVRGLGLGLGLGLV